MLWGLIASCVACLLYGFNIYNRFRHAHLPGPRPMWFLGNVGRTGDNQLGLMAKSYLALDRWAKRFGPCFLFWIGQHPVVVLSGGWLFLG